MDIIPTFEDANTPLEEPVDVGPKPIDPTALNEIAKVDEQATLLGVDSTEIANARASGDLSHESLAKQYPDLKGYLDTLYEGGASVEEASVLVKDYSKRLQEAVAPREFIFNSMLLVDEETVNPEALRLLTNYERLSNRIVKNMEESDPSTFKWLAAGTLDVPRFLFQAIVLDSIKRDEAKSVEYANTFSLPPEEFDAYWDEKLASPDGSGLFNIREYESLKDLQVLVDNFGVDEDAGFKQLLAIMDIATLGTTRVVGGLAARATAAGASKISGSTREIIKRVMSAKSPTEAITNILGPKSGAKAVVARMNSGDATSRTAGQAGPSSYNPFQGPQLPITAPHAATVVTNTTDSMVFDKLSKAMSSPVTGKAFSVEVLQNAVAKIAIRTASASNNAVVKFSKLIDEGSDNFKYTVTLGKSVTGDSFATAEEALKAVKNNPAYKVVEAPRVTNIKGEAVERLKDVEGGVPYTVNKKGYLLEYTERVNTKTLADELEDVALQEGFIKRGLAGIFSAPQTALGGRLGFMINVAEGIAAKAGKFANEAFKSVARLSKAEYEEVNTIFKGYRDGLLGDIETGLSVRRGAPSTEEFVTDFFSFYGRTPSEKQLESYRSLIDLSNASWNITATDILKRVAQRNGKVVTVEEGYDTLAVEVAEQLADDVIVFSRVSGPVTNTQIGSRIVYKLDEPFEASDGIFYDHVTDVVSARVPEKTDVLGYNVGGLRNNETMRHFIGTVYDYTLAGGRKVTGGFRTLLGSFSRREADTAVKQLNNIVDEILPFIKLQGLKGINKLALTGDDLARVNAVINKNNSWNPSITNLDDLKRVAFDHKETFINKFVVKARDSKVEQAIPEGVGMTTGQYQSMRVSRKRGDTPLMEYGGGRAVNQSPIKNIVEQFKSEAYRYTHYKATQAALNGWVQKARRQGNVSFDGEVPLNPEDFIRRAKVSNNTKLDAEMMQQQRAIKSRLGLMERTDAYTIYAQRFAEAIYDKSAFFGKGIKTKPEDWISGATGKARALVFHMKMGLANPDQFVLNASHVAQITAISPKYGLKAAPNVPIIAALLFKTRKAADADIANIIETTMKENGGALLMSKQELTDTVRYIRESGRDIIGATTLERSGAAINSSKTVVNEALELGLTPFKGGELYGRITAAAVAVMEHNAKGVSKSVFSQKGIQYVSNREQALTFRMTSGQKGRYQENSILALATQWQSYSLRYVDNILIGRDLNKIERARLAAANTVLFGLRGMGGTPKFTAGMAALGIDPEDENAVAILNRVKFGLFDLALSKAVGTDVSLGTRISPLNGIVRQYSELVGKDPLLEVVGGPSVQIFTESYKATRDLVDSLINKRFSVAYEDFKTLTRGVKSVDMYSKIVELIETGQYRSKRRGVAGEFSKEEITFPLITTMIAGATPMRVLNHYDAEDISYKEDSKFKDARSRVKRYADQGLELIRTGDPDKIKEGEKLYEDALDLIYDGGFSQENQNKLISGILNINTITDMLKRTEGQSEAARLTAKAAQGE